MYRLIAGLLALVSFSAWAGDATLTCTPPTQFTDGTSITGTITYKFYRGTSATTQATASAVQPACAFTWTGLAPGTHFFSSTATVGGVESNRSNVTSVVVPNPTPNPPTNLLSQLVAWIRSLFSRWA